jgi:hypothetical protein
MVLRRDFDQNRAPHLKKLDFPLRLPYDNSIIARKGIAVDFDKLVNFSLLSCGLVGVLMLAVAVLTFLRNRQKISNRTGTLIIVLVLLLALIALSVAEN